MKSTENTDIKATTMKFKTNEKYAAIWIVAENYCLLR